MEFNFSTNSSRQTEQLGEYVASLLKDGDQITLNGQLGMGKTILVKGLATGLNIHTPITSPTFNLVNVYDGNLKLKHFDLYRLENQETDLDLLDMVDDSGVSVLEWAQFASSMVKKDHLIINLTGENNDRILQMKSTGVRSGKILEQIIEHFN